MYRETTQLLEKTLSEKAEATSRRIEQFVSEIERQISWATRASADTIEQRRSDYALLLQQVPAIDRVIQLDGAGKEAAEADSLGARRCERHRLLGRSEIHASARPVGLAVAGLFRRT